MTNKLITKISDVSDAKREAIKSDYGCGDGPYTIRANYGVSVTLINKIVGNRMDLK